MRRCGWSYEDGVKTSLLPGLRGELVAIHSRHADVHDHGGGTIVWHAVNPDGPS
jgi:hypothetical protein